MKSIGIICEYNPFHNGHLYHINEVKKLFPNYNIILVISGPFTERGDISILTKWEKAEIALFYGVDLVVELPFIYASGSADLFSKGAITILKELKIEYLVFGSEENNIEKLTTLASIQLEEKFDQKVQAFMSTGINYPTALSKVLKEITNITVSSPNDLLGISYIKEIMKQKANITPISIQRTNDYHSEELNGNIVSATSIRKALQEHIDIKNTVPLITLSKIHNIDIELYFPYFKYKIISEKNNLLKYHEVSEKLIPRMIESIVNTNSFDEFIHTIKSKSETYSKLKRICLYILCGLTKEEAIFYKKYPYIRILGFSEKGKQYLHDIKKEISIPIISNYSNDKGHLLKLDNRVHQIYCLAFPNQQQAHLLKEELKRKPIYKNEFKHNS